MSSITLRKLVNHTLGRTLYRMRYQPKGIFDHLESYLESDDSGNDKGILLHHAYEAPTAYRSVFGASLSPYVDLEMSSHGRESWICCLERGRIDTDKGSSVAVFNRAGALLGEVSFQYVKNANGTWIHGEVHQNNVFHRKYLTSPKVVSGCVFSLLSGGGGNNNFYHWFVDVLSRLAFLRESGWQDRVDYFLVPNYAYPYQRESLELLGIPKEKIINGFQYPHIQADELIVTSHPRTTTYYTPSYLTDFLREAFTSYLGEEDDTLGHHPLIYINRGDAPKRKVVNEAEVSAVLDEYGFTSFSLSNLSLRQAIQLFGRASVIVAPHGAGLTNILFCWPGTRVIELFSDKFVNPYFYELATNLGLQYDFSVGTPLNAKVIKTRYEGIDENIHVDVVALRDKLSQIRSVSP